MIYKSYILEKNIDQIVNYNAFLFYGENEGLKKTFKKLIKSRIADKPLIYFQEEILKNKDSFIEEILNKSLFDQNKIFFVDEVDDKILDIFEKYSNIEGVKFFIFSKILNKKSKLRSFFEKSKKFGVTACYEDNEITLRNIITEQLKHTKGLTPSIINYIIKSIGTEREKIINELEKIQIYFHDKDISIEKLNQLLNLSESNDFNKLKAAALMGNKLITNDLISNTIFEEEKSIYYVNSISISLQKIRDLIEKKEKSSNTMEMIIQSSPQIFWKDKPNLLIQTKKWNKKKIVDLTKKLYELELQIKKNSFIKKDILIGKLIVDVVNQANT